MVDEFIHEDSQTYRSHKMMRDHAKEDRPREKALEFGLGALTNAELLAILVGSGVPGLNVLDLCKQIMDHNDNLLRNVERMSIKDFTRYKGIGEVKAITICAAMELSRRCRNEKFGEQPQIKTSEDIYAIMREKLEWLDHEELWVLALNQRNSVVSKICVSKGGTSATVGDVKLILKALIQHLACAAVLVHNHPSDSMQPSAPDDDLTKRVNDGCTAVGIRMLDHVIVSRAGYYSYADYGRL